jgi:hypothetical protein
MIVGGIEVQQRFHFSANRRRHCPRTIAPPAPPARGRQARERAVRSPGPISLPRIGAPCITSRLSAGCYSRRVEWPSPPVITRLLTEWSNGNEAALAELTPYVYQELHALARSSLNRGPGNQTLQPTALISEAYLRLIDSSKPVRWENRSHFFRHSGAPDAAHSRRLRPCARRREARRKRRQP